MWITRKEPSVLHNYWLPFIDWWPEKLHSAYFSCFSLRYRATLIWFLANCGIPPKAVFITSRLTVARKPRIWLKEWLPHLIALWLELLFDGTEGEQRACIFPSQETVSKRFTPHTTNGRFPKEQAKRELCLFDPEGLGKQEQSFRGKALMRPQALGCFFQLSEMLLLSPAHSENPPYPNITNHIHWLDQVGI